MPSWSHDWRCMHNPFEIIVAPDPAPTPTTAASCKNYVTLSI